MSDLYSKVTQNMCQAKLDRGEQKFLLEIFLSKYKI